MSQNSPLAGLTHKRKSSALSPDGLSRDRAGMEVRDIRSSHYGRTCPIEAPESPNIGLTDSLTSFARINAFGFIETPYRRVIDGRVTDQIDYLTADEKDWFSAVQANAVLDAEGHLVEERVLVHVKHGDVDTIPATDVEYMDVSPRQMAPMATALIPFLEHDDASRALMDANMQRQAVLLIHNEVPLIDTGMEYRTAVDVGDVTLVKKAGVVPSVTVDVAGIANNDATYSSYRFEKLVRFNAGTYINQRPLVAIGDHVEVDAPLADGPCTGKGELVLGKNLLVAFMPWEGLNYEDTIILSQRLVQDDILTSIHIEEHGVDARDTKLGAGKTTRGIPNVSDEVLADLDKRGIVHIGAKVSAGDILVGKVTPKGETELTPEEYLLCMIFGEKACEVRDTSLKVPHGESGAVIGTRVFDTHGKDGLPPGADQLVRVHVAQKCKISDGDKPAGRYGDRGVTSKILPVEDVPFLADGTSVDIVPNPLGVPSHMNIRQVLESHLGWIAKTGWDITGIKGAWTGRLHEVSFGRVEADSRVAAPIFDGADEHEITGPLENSLTTRDRERLIDGGSRAQLFDGRSSEPYPEKTSVGYMYMLRLHHLVDDKVHARSIGPYSMATRQPLGGKAQFGDQRFDKMEVWAFEAYGVVQTLRELLTIKFDDVPGHVEVYGAIVKGENIPEPGVPESFEVLARGMQSLCLNVEALSGGGRVINLRDSEDDLRSAKDFGIDLGRRPGGSHLLDVTEV